MARDRLEKTASRLADAADAMREEIRERATESGRAITGLGRRSRRRFSDCRDDLGDAAERAADAAREIGSTAAHRLERGAEAMRAHPAVAVGLAAAVAVAVCVAAWARRPR